MTHLSLRLRLFLAGAVAVSLALAVGSAGLAMLFERHVERRAFAELDFDLDRLAAGLERDADGALALQPPPSDPRFDRPLSGLYWQIEAEGERIRSRSLWDHVLALPSDALSEGATHHHRIAGPADTDLLVAERLVTPLRRLEIGPVRVAAAMDRGEVRRATTAFAGDLAPYVGVLGIVLIAAMWIQIAVGLRPLRTLGERVARIRSGEASRLGGDFPPEVGPLAIELDALLAARDREIVRARERAGDLAHRLKTPLQALFGEAARLRDREDGEAADGIAAVAADMKYSVDRELARARVAASAHTADATGLLAKADAAEAVRRVLSVLERTPDGARLDLSFEAHGNVVARIEIDDLTEALGALLENAVQYAARRVETRVRQRADQIVIAIRDDGPGIPDGLLAGLMNRGARLDGPGTGLGLAIAADIIEASGGTLSLRNAAPGLEATIILAAADQPS